VDIIVSEWMGYCLLYEAMLDSVLWARDRYLAPHGLMIPSHMTLHIAPFADPDYISDHITFWQSVYGFQMSSMLTHIHDEVFIQHLQPSSVPASSYPFLQLPLHTITKEDLTFANRTFTIPLDQDIDALDGFVIWFDAFFQPARDHTIPASTRAEQWPRDSAGGSGVAFTTGPAGPDTHWRQGVLLIDHGKRIPPQLKKGHVIEGTVGYKKREDNSRELDIELQWRVDGAEETGKQVWFMR
jgi:type I protein arginine methyltransferase